MSRFPSLGEHTEAVLRETLGLGDDELTALRRDGVVSDPDPEPGGAP